MKLKIKEIAVFGMLGSIMFASKYLTEMLPIPNMHLLGVFIVAITAVYRAKALYPIYVFVILLGLSHGFTQWWVPYLYIWTILWGMAMLIPKKMPPKIESWVYMTVCALHGFLYGTFYSVFEGLVNGLGFWGTVAWIIKGIPFDITHGVSNFVLGVLIVPLIRALKYAEKRIA